MKLAIVGGGAAGFFAAIAAAEANSSHDVVILEKTSQFLGKVRVSGGGRCNVTHSCFEPRDFTARYPRGERALIAPFHHFGVTETVAWFQQRGVRLKTEIDGRMFPVTDSSGTVIDCLLHEAKMAGVKLRPRSGVKAVTRTASGFELQLDSDERVVCDRLLLATGGTRNTSGAALVHSLGHTLTSPVPSLFSFQASADWMSALAGVSLNDAEVSVEGTKLRERGALLITHRGVSGPVILRLSAWGARELHARDYRFDIRIRFLPDMNAAGIAAEFQAQRDAHPNRLVLNSPIANLPARLWETLARRSGVTDEMRWTNCTRAASQALASALIATPLEIAGQSLNKDEFVTCGGVALKEVNFKTMESRLVPYLYFAGEILDIDGITGGFNFQSAWTTGWIAGNAMAQK